MLRTLSYAVILAILVPVAAAAQSVAAVERGKKVYAAEKCSVCHSVAGVGNKRGSLDAVGTKLTADEVRQWIVSAPEMTTKTKAERKPFMKAYAGLAKDDLDALVAYMASLKK